MDSHGCFYMIELPRVRWHTVVHDFRAALSHKSVDQVPCRGRADRRSAQSGFTHLVKLAAAGDARNRRRSWPGLAACRANGGCYCDWPDMHTAVDAADRMFVADIDLHMVKVLNPAGNMIARSARWGNAETRPTRRQCSADRLPPDLLRGNRGRLAVVSDKDLRRIAKIRMDYRQTEQALDRSNLVRDSADPRPGRMPANEMLFLDPGCPAGRRFTIVASALRLPPAMQIELRSAGNRSAMIRTAFLEPGQRGSSGVLRMIDIEITPG